MIKKTVISKINATGAMRRSVPSQKRISKLDRTKPTIYCSIENDPFVTYMVKTIWLEDLNKFIYPPYVECEYVE